MSLGLIFFRTAAIVISIECDHTCYPMIVGSNELIQTVIPLFCRWPFYIIVCTFIAIVLIVSVAVVVVFYFH